MRFLLILSRIPSPSSPFTPLASRNPHGVRMQPDHASLRDDKPERMLYPRLFTRDHLAIDLL